MKSRSLMLTLILIICLAGVPLPGHAGFQQALTFSGHIKTKSTANPQLSIKLYPPKKTNDPVILTTSDEAGNFQFTNLLASSYLLEIYLGADLLYQEIIELNSSICCEIDLSGETGKRACPCAPSRRRKG
jgi:hypothetical protein